MAGVNGGGDGAREAKGKCRQGRVRAAARLYILIWRRQYIFKLEFIRCQKQRARARSAD
jgi:hypothetical protein